MQKIIEVDCPAKINLYLNIINHNQESNLYGVKMLNQTVDLCDHITIQEKDINHNGIVILIDSNIPKNENNTCFKAAELFFRYNNIHPSNIEIKIKKNIPINKGLGGSATDAAGVLLGLNEYYKTNLSKRELMFLAFIIGYDVPYFINSGYCYVSKYGQDIQTLHDNPYKNYLIIQPNISLNVTEMYEKMNNKLLINKSIPNNLLLNDFTSVMPEELKRLRDFLNDYKLNHSLSGCGPSYFIAYNEKNLNSHMKIVLQKEFPNYKYFSVKNTDGHRILINYKKINN